MKEELQALVDRDSLTGLANRRALPEALRECGGSGATLLFFDLNDFKEINDSYGHSIGDECLRRFASALRATFGEDGRLFRYGGDEFVVIATGDAGRLVNELRERLEQERVSPRIRFSAAVRAGYARSSSTSTTPPRTRTCTVRSYASRTHTRPSAESRS